MMTDTQQNDGPPFLADLADDAVMTGTVLAKSLKGKDVISQVIRSIASCFVSQSMSGHAVDGGIETIEYDAELESGGTIHGSVTVTRVFRNTKRIVSARQGSVKQGRGKKPAARVLA